MFKGANDEHGVSELPFARLMATLEERPKMSLF